MTVQELIDKLLKVEDKTKLVVTPDGLDIFFVDNCNEAIFLRDDDFDKVDAINIIE